MGFVPFTFIDLIDILFVAYIMYWIYRTTKGTNAPYIISGIIVVYLLWVIVRDAQHGAAVDDPGAHHQRRRHRADQWFSSPKYAGCACKRSA